MKKFKYIIFLATPLVALWFFTSSYMKEKQVAESTFKKTPSPAKKSIAVMELFTSQGCSSCPSADRLLGKYTSSENVIPLSFHVDYWDRLGWKDPYSSKEYTQRQYKYASSLHASVYTPQLVINGVTEMIGSDANRVSWVLKSVQDEEPEATISIKSVQEEKGKANVSFDASGNVSNAILNIAVAEKKTTTTIEAGENGGVTLNSYNVVRNFKTINQVSNGSSSATIEVPADADQKNISIVIFLQDKKTNRISSAAQSGL